MIKLKFDLHHDDHVVIEKGGEIIQKLPQFLSEKAIFEKIKFIENCHHVTGY